ncbi:tetratricopeptide repeat protein [Microcoleus sp. MON1_C1]|uniref:tetratricopeptide repeat protein n=1 Tax=Microcoleus sp. MON1_C1 TaxID=2818827 RepID=UPI002FCF7D58
MYENRSAAYWQLIQKLLKSSKGEESQILNAHSDLLDPGLLATIIAVAKQFDDGNQNEANFLTNIALELGKFLGKDHQPTAIRKQTGDILLNWGTEQYYISHIFVAFQCWQQSLIIYQAIHDRQGEASSFGNLGITYCSLGEYEQAIAVYEKSLAISREIKYGEGEASSLGGLGIAYYYLGEYERAISFHEQHLAISREIKNRFGEASSLGGLGTAYDSLGEYERAIAFHEKSLAIFQEIKNRQGEASSLGSLGNSYRSLGQNERGIAFYEKSLAIFQEIENRQGAASSLGGLGTAYDFLGEYERAIDYHEQSLAIFQEIKNRQGEASSIAALGNAYYSLGQIERAIAFYEKSLAIFQEIKNRQGEASSLAGLGIAYHSLGEYERAIDYHKQSLAIRQEIKDPLGEAGSLGNLGNAYYSLGEYERAIGFHEQHLAISREIKNRQGEATSLGNLGKAYYSLGEYERAIGFHEQHLAISREIKNRQGEASSLGSLGNAYYSLEEYERAIAFYYKSLAIEREIKNRQGEASSLGGLGIAYDSLGEYERAIDYHEQSLAIKREIKNCQGEANSLNNIGIVYRRLQQPEKAIKNYQDSLKIAIPETMPPECFAAGRNLGNIGFTKGDWHLALEGYEPAIKAVEQLRKGSTTDDRRQKIIAEAISVYANAVQCYINLKQYDRAVETADRSRSRHLADLFASKDLYPQGEIPPEVEAYYRLQQQSDRLRISENDGTKAIAATRQPTPNGDGIIQKIKELEDEKQKAWLKIRSKDQVLAAQLQPAPLSFYQMQALIPDAETAILNFYTTAEHTHIFILRQSQATKLHTCEGQGLETLQNWLLNNWLRPYVENKTAWKNQMGEFLPELANRLQINQLISQHLNGIQELIIIPHLYLHQIPFAALPLNNSPIPHSNTASDRTRGLKPLSKPTLTPAKTQPQKQPEYLSDKFRLRIVPSCQILNFCHQRGNLKPATMGIVENATGDLVFTGYECETLAIMHQIDKNSRLEYEQATIGNYHNLLNQVQVLHSSHHASADLNNSLESKLHLFDGDINLGRVFTWRFTDLAEVFLSCCETNLTFTQITDDPLSIASGFLCAGARNVVSTLWAVDDLATALFCILYYQEKQDNSRSQALQKAQFKLRNLTGDELSSKYQPLLEDYFEQQKGEKQAEIVKNVRLRLDWLCRQELPFVSPHYWAGFVSQGLA